LSDLRETEGHWLLDTFGHPVCKRLREICEVKLLEGCLSTDTYGFDAEPRRSNLGIGTMSFRFPIEFLQLPWPLGPLAGCTLRLKPELLYVW
jgi:hypothetical protein